MELLIADDHVFIRKGLIRIIEAEFGKVNIEEAENGLTVMELIKNKNYDAIILDISMPELNGLETLKLLQQREYKTPVLVLSMHTEDQYALRVLRAGASGYLNKASAPEELINALQSILNGRKYITGTLAEKLAGSLSSKETNAAHELLSDREFLVLKMIASGKQVSGIAKELNLSVPTVSTYRARILTKMKMKSNSELTHYAISNGLIT